MDHIAAIKNSTDNLNSPDNLADAMAYCGRHGDGVLSPHMGRGIYGGYYVLSHCDAQRVQLVELVTHRIVNVSVDVFERDFAEIYLDECEAFCGRRPQLFNAMVEAIVSAMVFCMSNEKRLAQVD